MCAGIAAAPIPLADIIPLTAMQVGLVAAIAWIAGRSIDRRGAAEFLDGSRRERGRGLRAARGRSRDREGRSPRAAARWSRRPSPSAGRWPSAPRRARTTSAGCRWPRRARPSVEARKTAPRSRREREATRRGRDGAGRQRGAGVGAGAATRARARARARAPARAIPSPGRPDDIEGRSRRRRDDREPRSLARRRRRRLRRKAPSVGRTRRTEEVVAIALLVCCAIAFALYASFPSRPPSASRPSRRSTCRLPMPAHKARKGGEGDKPATRATRDDKALGQG